MRKLILVILLFSILWKPGPATAQDANEASDWHKLMVAPMGVIGALCGTTVAVPVNISRKVRSESQRMYDTIADDVGSTGGLADRLIGLSLGVPYGIASGTILGCIYGFSQGTKYGYSKPFSQESFGFQKSSVPNHLP